MFYAAKDSTNVISSLAGAQAALSATQLKSLPGSGVKIIRVATSSAASATSVPQILRIAKPVQAAAAAGASTTTTTVAVPKAAASAAPVAAMVAAASPSMAPDAAAGLQQQLEEANRKIERQQREMEDLIERQRKEMAEMRAQLQSISKFTTDQQQQQKSD